MTYDNVATVTQIAALLIFVAFFIGVLVYAFWPGNKKRFQDAARLPLGKGSDEESEKRHG